ncbi:hypothetical protein LSTR_LSTR008555 [Laodelphax striatellus]|uniref:DH domain-containing protein n=1 Tax=Laodelphax striatellus TaxID=195883 RepID=A0A482XQZ6_LAOST|nr:hypothetical protein LSTR_LSTR008555 [Laodelphax striatellus]
MFLRKLKEVLIVWAVKRILSGCNQEGCNKQWMLQLLPNTNNLEIELTKIGGKGFLAMIEKDADKIKERRRQSTSRKWNKLLHRCEQASNASNNRIPNIETKWHIDMGDSVDDCPSNNTEHELMELKQAIIENEQSYIQELDVLHIQAKEVLRWHHAIPRFNRQCITKNLQKLKANASTIEEKVISVSHNDLQSLLEAMDDTFNDKFVSYLIIYCENIGELRALFKQKMRKDFQFCRLLFSSYFQIERSLLPIHRVSKLHSFLTEILDVLGHNSYQSNSTLYNQATLLEAKLSEIVTKCHEVTHSILGTNYMNNILQALFPFDLKLQESFQSPKVDRKHLKDGCHTVFKEQGMQSHLANDLKVFTDEVLNTPSHKTDVHNTGSSILQDQCDNLEIHPRLNPATSTESIFNDSESSGILKAIEQSALKLQLKPEDDEEDGIEEKEEAGIIARLQRRRRTISEREARCVQRFAEILREEEEESRHSDQTSKKCRQRIADILQVKGTELRTSDPSAESPKSDDLVDDLEATNHSDHECQCGVPESAQKFGANGECSHGMIVWDGSRKSSNADVGKSTEISKCNVSGTTQNRGSSLYYSWNIHETVEAQNLPQNGETSSGIGAYVTSALTQTLETNPWKQCWEDTDCFSRYSTPRPYLSRTDSLNRIVEVIEMSEFPVSTTIESTDDETSHPIGDELLRLMEASFGFKQRSEEKEGEEEEEEEEEEEKEDYETDAPTTTLSDEGHRVGDSSIFYDLPFDSAKKDSKRESWKSEETVVIDEETNAKGGKRMKRVSEVLQRTLWEETERVIQENVLGNMTKADIAQQESKFEILTSELSYLNSLNILVTVFMNSKELSSILSKSDQESLFKHIIKVKKASELFLYDLAGQWEEDIFLSGIYCEIEKHSRTSLKVYVDYCSNQVNLHRTLQRLLLEDEKFVELTNFLQRSSECFGNSLNSFLMLPMQRVTRLPLLLETIERRLPADSDEKKECQLTLDSLHKLVHECNEAVRDAEDESCIEEKYGHKKKLSLNSLEPLTPKPSHRKWSLFNIREIKLNG